MGDEQPGMQQQITGDSHATSVYGDASVVASIHLLEGAGSACDEWMFSAWG